MAVQNQVLFLVIMICTVVVIANQCGKHAVSPREKKVSDGISKQKDEMKKQQENVKALVDRMAAEIAIQRKTCSVASCQELHEKDPSFQSGVHRLVFGRVYCHIGNFGCGDGGWTPVMKIAGHKLTFVYDSGFWSNKTVFNSEGGMTGFDQKETMLPSYWSTPLSRICLGMMIHGQINFVVINKSASSLHSLIADGVYRPTSLGRDKWKSLIGSKASLQHHCNLEGFNAIPGAKGRTRIGYIANNENNCGSCDSFIGFGSMDYMSCGNFAEYGWYADNGARYTTAMGYILVQ